MGCGRPSSKEEGIQSRYRPWNLNKRIVTRLGDRGLPARARAYYGRSSSGLGHAKFNEIRWSRQSGLSLSGRYQWSRGQAVQATIKRFSLNQREEVRHDSDGLQNASSEGRGGGARQ